MYRLVLYILIALLSVAEILAFFQLLPFTPLTLLISTLFLITACWVTNTIFARIFNAQTNIESVYISALILALILPPIKIPHDVIFLGWVSLWTMASKYLLTLNRKHVFNPVAFGVWITGLGLMQYANWWVGTAVMMPAVLIGGLLLVRKLRREDLVFSFLISALLTIVAFGLLSGNNIFVSLQRITLNAPLLFLAFIMLTEPLTTPPTKGLQVLYGIFVGILFTPQVQLFAVHTTPESALLIGNIFSFLVSPKSKLFLHLKQKIQVSDDIIDFIFTSGKRFSFLPGQYMEWTLSHPHTDSRGSRRYFTLSSSPTESDVRIGVRFADPGSSFKKTLQTLTPDKIAIASQIAGDFILAKNQKQKLVFVAGGIGITPFRSMVKFLIDKKQKRDIVLLYASKLPTEFIYKEIFDQAEIELGIKIVYTITDKQNDYSYWQGKKGRINSQMITEEVPDYKERLFYLSGPREMVKGFEQALKNLGIAEKQIKTDFFPGFI